jgi:hypothetical protein
MEALDRSKKTKGKPIDSHNFHHKGFRRRGAIGIKRLGIIPCSDRMFVEIIFFIFFYWSILIE